MWCYGDIHVLVVLAVLQDLPFNVYDEMTLLHPMPDLCWYYAQKFDHPEEKGTIPVTHVRLVYVSDDGEFLCSLSYSDHIELAANDSK